MARCDTFMSRMSTTAPNGKDKRHAWRRNNPPSAGVARGGYEARAVGYSIFTLGDAWDGLKYMMRDAVMCRFDEEKTFHIS